MVMRKSRVLQKLRTGQVASSFKVNFYDARICELTAMAGFDCIWIDQEHIAPDWAFLSGAIWASKAHDTDVMVRVSRGGYSDYIRPLEMDATGIMVPHIMDVEDAKKVIQMTRFHPVGRRPIDGGGADAAYSVIPMSDYMQEANDERFLVLQIEDPEAMIDLDSIAALDGFDMLFFGPGDFSQGIGAPGEWGHPKLIDARRRVAEAANAHGKFAGTVGTLGNLRALVEMGYHFVNVASDTSCLKKYCGDLVNGFAQMASEKVDDF